MNKNQEQDFKNIISNKEERKIHALKNKNRAVWFGLGTFGLVGWSVMVPTIIGIALGVWIDSRWPSKVSWTLTLLFIGITIGCYNAWYWINRERKLIEKEREIV